MHYVSLHQVKCTQEKFYLTTMAVIDLKTHKGEWVLYQQLFYKSSEIYI